MTHSEAQMLMKLISEAFHEQEINPSEESKSHPDSVVYATIAAQVIRKFTQELIDANV